MPTKESVNARWRTSRLPLKLPFQPHRIPLSSPPHHLPRLQKGGTSEQAERNSKSTNSWSQWFPKNRWIWIWPANIVLKRKLVRLRKRMFRLSYNDLPSMLELQSSILQTIRSDQVLQRLNWSLWKGRNRLWIWINRWLKFSKRIIKRLLLEHRRRQDKIVLKVSKLNLERSALVPKVNAKRCTVSVSAMLKNATRTSANARTARMMIRSRLSRRVRLKRKSLKSHSKERDAIVERIHASKTTAFVTKLVFIAWLAFAHVRTASTTMVLQNCPKSLRKPKRLLFKRAKAQTSQSKNEHGA